MLNKKIFYINSESRDEGTDSDFLFSLPVFGDDYTHCSLLQCSIPKSYYLIQDNFNTFTLDENGTEFTITIPKGNYSRTSFQTQIQTQLNAVGAYTYTVSVPDTTAGNPETGKFTFTVSGNGGIQPIFTFTSFLYEPMGFEAKSSNAFVGDSLESVNVINLQKENTLFIHSDLCTNGDDNVLQEIYTNNTSDYGNIIFLNSNVQESSKRITTIDNVYRFYLTDENGQAIDLNGRNWVMSLMLYKPNNKMEEMVKKYIQWKVR